MEPSNETRITCLYNPDLVFSQVVEKSLQSLESQVKEDHIFWIIRLVEDVLYYLDANCLLRHCTRSVSGENYTQHTLSGAFSMCQKGFLLEQKPEEAAAVIQQYVV